ncbi:MAG: hypothetical protein WKG07_00960 [Hymenobacter sp.]
MPTEAVVAGAVGRAQPYPPPAKGSPSRRPVQLVVGKGHGGKEKSNLTRPQPPGKPLKKVG